MPSMVSRENKPPFLPPTLRISKLSYFVKRVSFTRGFHQQASVSHMENSPLAKNPNPAHLSVGCESGREPSPACVRGKAKQTSCIEK